MKIVFLDVAPLMFLTATGVAVVFILVISSKIDSTFDTDDFKYVKWSWVANLCYILISIADVLFQLTHPDIAKSVSSASVRNILNVLGYTFEILQFGLLYHAFSKTGVKLPYKKEIRVIGKYWYVFSIVLWILMVISDNYIFRNIAIGLNVFFALIALVFAAEFFKNMFIGYKVPYKHIYVGTLLYGALQVSGFFLDPINNSSYGPIALIWSISLMSKIMIGYGLLMIFEAEAIKSQRMETLQKKVFHEIKNAMFGIDAPAKRILFGKNSKPRNDANDILKTNQHILSIIDATNLIYGDSNLLDLEKGITSNVDQLTSEKKEIVNFNGLVEVAVRLVKNITGNSVEYHVDYGGNVKLSCLKHEIIQIIINILKNSYEAFPEGKGEIWIKTRNKFVDEDENQVRGVYLSITDSGPGIPKEIQDRIYENGFTTKGDSGGSGIGMYVVKEVVERYRGKIKIFSPVSKSNLKAIFHDSVDYFAEQDKYLYIALSNRGTQFVISFPQRD